LRASVEQGIDPAACQAAAISFKNIVNKYWASSSSKEPSPFSEQDKAAVRDLLLQGISHAPPLIRSQLYEADKAVVHHDFPDKWPTLLPSIVAALQSGDQAAMAGAFRMLRLLARKYEFRDEEERGPLEVTTNATFPILLPLFETLIATDSPSPDLADMIKLICKTFWSASYMEFPNILTQDERQFRGWLNGFLALLNKPLPLEQMPSDPDLRTSWMWWKLKKWVLKIVNRLFDRFIEPDIIPENDTKGRFVAHHFKGGYAVPMLHAVLQSLAGLSQGAYMPQNVINYLLHYVQQCIAYTITWNELKPHVESLTLQVAFPLLCFSQDDAELWEEDACEYIRRGYDMFEDLKTSKNGALEYMISLIDARPKKILDPIMQHVAKILVEYKNAAAALSNNGSGGGGPSAAELAQLASQADGALLLVGSILNTLRKKKHGYKDQLEPMLVHHVLPMFESRFGHLRAKACWLAGSTTDTVKFAGGVREGTFPALLQRVVAALGDEDLPVRVDAAVSVRLFLDELEDKEALELLEPAVPQLLHQFLDLSHQVDNEDLTMSLEAIVARYSESVAPHAVHLCAHLAQQFWKLVGSAEEKDDDDSNGDYDPTEISAAYAVLQTIGTVMASIASQPHLFPQIEEIMWPVLERYTSTEGQDVFEEVMEIVTYLTYYAPEISPRMWSLYPRILQCLNEWALDGFDAALHPLDNYIDRGTEVFLSTQIIPNNNLVEMTEFTIAKALLTEGVDADSAAAAPKLASVILQHCRGRVDSSVPKLLKMAADSLMMEGIDRGVADAVLVMVADVLYYNPILAVSCMSSLGKSGLILGALSKTLSKRRKTGKMVHFRSCREKKIVALGLTSLLMVPTAQLPVELTHSPQALGQVVAATVHLLEALMKQEKEAAADEEASGINGDDDDDDDFDFVSDDDEDEEDDLDEEYLSNLEHKRAQRGAGGSRKNHDEDAAAFADYDDDDDDGDDDDDWWIDDDDEEVSCPFDNISPYSFFMTTLDSAAMHNAGLRDSLDAGSMEVVGMIAARVQGDQMKSQGSGGDGGALQKQK
jgi:importin-7